MSKAVLISIRPKWCELIASREKTIEVRKTRPKIETPFKCYIYETRGFERAGNDSMNCVVGGNGRGKVIGEFVCDEINRYAMYGRLKEPARYMKSSLGGYPATEIHFADLKLSPSEFEDYGKGAPLFGWHISNLVIYDEPKNLNEFMKPCDPDPDGVPLCLQCKRLGENWCGGTILRPPQSYCFVEELS